MSKAHDHFDKNDETKPQAETELDWLELMLSPFAEPEDETTASEKKPWLKPVYGIDSVFSAVSDNKIDAAQAQQVTTRPSRVTLGAQRNVQGESSENNSAIPFNESRNAIVFYQNPIGLNLSAISQAPGENEIALAPGAYQYERSRDRNRVLIFEAKAVDDPTKDPASTEQLQELAKSILNPEYNNTMKTMIVDGRSVIIAINNKQYNLTELMQKGDINKISISEEDGKRFVDYALLHNKHNSFIANLFNQSDYAMQIVKANDLAEGEKLLNQSQNGNRFVLIGNTLHALDAILHPIILNQDQVNSIQNKLDNNAVILNRREVADLNHEILNQEVIKHWEATYQNKVASYNKENNLASSPLQKLNFSSLLSANMYTGPTYAPANMLIKGDGERLWSQENPTDDANTNKIIKKLRNNPSDIGLVFLTSVFVTNAIRQGSEKVDCTMRLEKQLPGYVVNSMQDKTVIQQGVVSSTFGKSSYIDKESIIKRAEEMAGFTQNINQIKKELLEKINKDILFVNNEIRNNPKDEKRLLKLGAMSIQLNNFKSSINYSKPGSSLKQQLDNLHTLKTQYETYHTENVSKIVPKLPQASLWSRAFNFIKNLYNTIFVSDIKEPTKSVKVKPMALQEKNLPIKTQEESQHLNHDLLNKILYPAPHHSSMISQMDHAPVKQIDLFHGAANDIKHGDWHHEASYESKHAHLQKAPEMDKSDQGQPEKKSFEILKEAENMVGSFNLAKTNTEQAVSEESIDDAIKEMDEVMQKLDLLDKEMQDVSADKHK